MNVILGQGTYKLVESEDGKYGKNVFYICRFRIHDYLIFKQHEIVL